MSYTLITAAPAAGKTTYLLKRARQATLQNQRVWWIGLPNQRNYIYQQATKQGALLGLEFLSSQQLYYRLLAHALNLQPLIKGTGRLALVGQALLTLRQELPSPGEAQLFASAIAEVKRYGLRVRDVKGTDVETERFKAVYDLYERLKAERWDYDDFRIETLRLLESNTMSASMIEADLIIIDGFRDVGPLELRIYKALAAYTKVFLALPEAPPGETPDVTLRLPDGVPARVQHSYRLPNTVSEARWVMRSLKKDLADGMDPLDLAIIIPERNVKTLVALADEYGVPLMDETPKSLTDSVAGRLLLDLLELPDYPTASRLLGIPELNALANAALEKGVAGLEAMSVLANSTGVSAAWQKWLALLSVPDDELAWAKNLLDTLLPDVRGDVQEDAHSWKSFKEHALERAKEASSLAKGASFRAWWAALLQETITFHKPDGGVALVTAKLVSGRQFKKAYLMHAVEGAYTVGESEDYFVPEEQRVSLDTAFKHAALPRRYLGRNQALFDELLTRANTMIITYSDADQGGPMVAETELTTQTPPQPAPPLPAASRLELLTEQAYRAAVAAAPLGRVGVEGLRRYEQCAFQFWAERQVFARESDDELWWRRFLRDLRAHSRLNAARIEVLKGAYPEAAHWLAEHAPLLTQLTFGEVLPSGGELHAYIDAAIRHKQEVQLYRFCEPTPMTVTEADKYINGRWNELWAAGHLLEAYGGRIKTVHVLVWPVNHAPVVASGDGISYVWRRIKNRQESARRAFARFKRGDIQPNSGFHCRNCRVFDMCREGSR